MVLDYSLNAFLLWNVEVQAHHVDSDQQCILWNSKVFYNVDECFSVFDVGGDCAKCLF